MATQSWKCDGRKKWNSRFCPSHLQIVLLYSNMLNCGHAVFACCESTLAVHSENPFMVSNLTTGNLGQLKMSPKFRPLQKRRFWIWPRFLHGETSSQRIQWRWTFQGGLLYQFWGPPTLHQRKAKTHSNTSGLQHITVILLGSI